MKPLVLSHFEVKPLLEAKRQQKESVVSSGDLGRTTSAVLLRSEGCVWSDTLVSWSVIELIAEEEKKCFLVDGETIEEIRTFSETTQWVRSLWPTGRAPTTVVAGFPMHRIQGIDPLEDTKRKVEGASPITGRVLDTATGLGYTAIYAAKFATSVVTVELDPAAIELAKKNPWSRELFESPKITQHIGDVGELIQGFEKESFSQIIHDPPTFKLGGELYSTDFYRELHRVLKKNGRVSHYIGDPESTSGKRTTKGVIQRLQDAGFSRVTSNPKAFGVVATK
jgi:predicted methyltransferase